MAMGEDIWTIMTACPTKKSGPIIFAAMDSCSLFYVYLLSPAPQTNVFYSTTTKGLTRSLRALTTEQHKSRR